MSPKSTSFKIYSLMTNVSFALSILLLETAQAAIQHTLNNLKVIEAPISKRDLTRIAVEEDRILNVFGMTGEYSLEADEEHGQIFIRPQSLNNSKPIHLTFVTEGGYTQDLRLIPKDQLPETLIFNIHRESSKQKPSLNMALQPEITRDEVEDLIYACRDNRIPLGYKAIPLNITTPTEFYPLIRELKGEKLRCLTYEVRNITEAPVILAEVEFAANLPSKKKDLIAILMPIKSLNSGETTEAYVVTRIP
ncbi:MAG: type-F conjugative transfer system secretin TraK [Proteobacteria bacterium]|nr:type-F conjugative transfer system secretin TraK [Pseudomonadota bacterium]